MILLRIAGLFFLGAFLAYGFGNGMIDSVLKTNEPVLILNGKDNIILGSILIFINSIFVWGIGIIFFPILKKFQDNLAIAYITSRIIEGIFLIIGMAFLFLIVFISETVVASSDIASFKILFLICKKVNFIFYQFAMISLGIGSLALCFILYQYNLISKIISILGIIGYTSLAIGGLLELTGMPLGIIFSIPGGIFELIFGILLLWKGIKE